MRTYYFKSVEAKISFKNYKDLKFFSLPEFCFTGRSNVGKSSLINALLNRKSIATTSNKPGHTKKIFLFTVDKKFILVDLPGYGFARLSQKKTSELSELLFHYITNRKNLKLVFILIDARRGIKNYDKIFMDFLEKYQINYRIILTKTDKISENEKKSLAESLYFSKFARDNFPLFTSVKTKKGIKDIRKEIINSLSIN